MLTVTGLHAHYGKSHILRGVDFDVGAGEIVSILGRNGSGRSTALKAMMGLVRPSGGSVRLAGEEMAGSPPHRIVRHGLAYVPEERLAFHNLTVEDNLRMGMWPARPDCRAWTVAEMYGWFPRLAERRRVLAGSLSGGEQQMLTICRSLLGNPKAILIDEPTEGLAPRIVERVMHAIDSIRQAGLAVVLVEQKLAISMRVSDRIIVMGHGTIVFEGSPASLRARDDIRREWLEV